MEKKPISVKTLHKIYLILSWLGVIIALVGLFWGEPLKQILPWVGLAVVILSFIFRLTLVRCPHCGNHLAESKSIPDKCPECHKELH